MYFVFGVLWYTSQSVCVVLGVFCIGVPCTSNWAVVRLCGGSAQALRSFFGLPLLKLFPSYPNPFNSSTTIKFYTPKNSYIKLVVVDLLGRKIRTLYDGEIANGSHEIKWDGLNEYGNLIPSGVYLIQFISKEYSFQYKTVLIK